MAISLEQFETLAALFQADTGMMAPGKDVPAACGDGRTDDERRHCYAVWYRKRAFNSALDEIVRLRAELEADHD